MFLIATHRDLSIEHVFWDSRESFATLTRQAVDVSSLAPCQVDQLQGGGRTMPCGGVEERRVGGLGRIMSHLGTLAV